ncbi:MAG TPA: hypothetical protein VOA88_01055 [Candidatus Dormibacteraeota bacterium]|nr:hypothetical protein [Candidatus Dormibacteraeota bacterium]
MNNAIRKRDAREETFKPPAPEKTENKFAEKSDVPAADASGRVLDKNGKLVVLPSRKELGHKIPSPLADQYK